METKVIELTEDQFFEQFQPIKNHLTSSACYQDCMFETVGEEHSFVRQIVKSDPNKVWTIVDSDGRLYITAGYHFVNRMGYLITEVPAVGNVEYIIKDPDYHFEVISEANSATVASVQMQDVLFEDYDEPESVPEWVWIRDNASYAHVKNGQGAGVFEFMLNLAMDFQNVPETLASIIDEARHKGFGFVLFHQGT